ncbi:hypothetical protein TELCIR_01524 [Teladorsagia circumcincta]|uniref:Uncharacterized protein n=1 Tax=Teladorsagia circumcincta TaxID=45464 RepID=A0A2G9V1P9_TELCI|nr:hypothetical protein TELCIR_01524 [Teladorsagia circumcincta]
MPPSTEDCSKMCLQGFEDALRFLTKNAFDEAFAAEESYFKYLLSFRMFRVARTALGVGKLPWDMLVILSKNMSAWATAVVAPQWLRVKLQSLIDFVLMEIEYQQLRYSRFSCLLPVPEMSIRSRREAEIELSEDARKELEVIRESDRRKKVKLDTVAAVASVSNDWIWLDDIANDDSVEHVIEYSRSHDAMYEFHYLDENRQLRSFELFNVANPKRHECHSRVNTGGTMPRPVTVVAEEPEQLEQEVGCSNNSEEADSGLSGVEGHTDSGRRDACCSPVRHFPSSPRVTSRGKSQGRRHAGSGGTPTSSRKQYPVSRSGSGVTATGCGAGADVRSTSSDSEGDGADRLFVPARRQRTSSKEYDGEPEPSDTDLLV